MSETSGFGGWFLRLLAMGLIGTAFYLFAYLPLIASGQDNWGLYLLVSFIALGATYYVSWHFLFKGRSFE